MSLADTLSSFATHNHANRVEPRLMNLMLSLEQFANTVHLFSM